MYLSCFAPLQWLCASALFNEYVWPWLYYADLRKRFEQEPINTVAELSSNVQLQCHPPSGLPIPEVSQSIYHAPAFGGPGGVKVPIFHHQPPNWSLNVWHAQCKYILYLWFPLIPGCLPSGRRTVITRVKLVSRDHAICLVHSLRGWYHVTSRGPMYAPADADHL